MNNFKKVDFDEIKNTFIVTWGGRKFSLFHRKPTIGISEQGIWIGTYAGIIQIGFLRWEWIDRIDISKSSGYVYFMLHDFEAVYNSIIPKRYRLDVNWYLVLKSDEGKVFAIEGNYFGSNYQYFIDTIQENNLADIRIIE